MKTIYVLAIIAWCGGGMAQTNPAAAAGVLSRVTHIDSDTAKFDLVRRQAVYRGNVRVSDPDMKMTCAWLVADLPQSGRMNHILAQTNVVIDFTDPKGETTHATGDQAVYNYNVENDVTNETITLTGNPSVENTQGTMNADVIVWDRINNGFQFTRPHGTFQNTNAAPAETNVSPREARPAAELKTNFPPGTFPPGTIENIDRMTQDQP